MTFADALGLFGLGILIYVGFRSMTHPYHDSQYRDADGRVSYRKNDLL
jgi:hypothetical protein